MQIVNIGGIDRILCDHDDSLISNTVMYVSYVELVHAAETDTPIFAYLDRECTIAATGKQIAEASTKGLLIGIVESGGTLDIFGYMIPMLIVADIGQVACGFTSPSGLVAVLIDGVDNPE